MKRIVYQTLKGVNYIHLNNVSCPQSEVYVHSFVHGQDELQSYSTVECSEVRWCVDVWG